MEIYYIILLCGFVLGSVFLVLGCLKKKSVKNVAQMGANSTYPTFPLVPTMIVRSENNNEMIQTNNRGEIFVIELSNQQRTFPEEPYFQHNLPPTYEEATSVGSNKQTSF